MSNRLLLLEIVVYFVDSLEKYYKAFIVLCTIANHSRDKQFSVLLSVLQDYSIVQKFGAIVGDNASTNDTLCAAAEEYLLKEEEIEWDATHWRIRCTGHIINLAVQAFLFQNIIEIDELELYDEKEKKGETGDEEERRAKFRLIGPLGQLHNIIVHIRGSTACTNEFLELAGRKVLLDNCTR